MENRIDKFNEKQKKHKYLAFLLHLYNLIPTTKFISFPSLQNEADKFQISKDILFVIFTEKLISIEHDGEQTVYKWASIRPNVYMAERLIKSEQIFKPTTKQEIEISKIKERPIQILPNNPINESKKLIIENLRPYQTDGIRKIFDKLKEGKRSVLFQMPTGTGKTVLFSEIVKKGFDQKRKILIVVHRRELIEQITNKLNEKGVSAGQIVAGKVADYSKIVQVASIQTLPKRKYPEAHLIIIDECHHSKAPTYKTLWKMYPEAKFLGVTATPCRLSGEGFNDLFDELIISIPVNEFIKHKYLVPITHYACASPNLTDVKKSKGDYVTKMLSDVMLDNSVMTDIVDSYVENCSGKSAIVFAVDIEHSKEIAQRFKTSGIIAEHIDAKTPKELRERILNDFKNGKIKVISNVEIITEGFDFPECQVVVLARPTKSLSLYLQMVGRVMRPANGKTEGIILDNAGLWLEHGLSTIDREWSLQGVAKKRKNDILPNREVAMDEEGFIKEINRSRPAEIKGLKLIPITFVLKKLLHFESLILNAKFKGHKLHTAYYQYLKYVEEGGKQITNEEFDYIKKRLIYLSSIVEPEFAVKPGFWFYEEQRMRNPIALVRQDVLTKHTDKTKLLIISETNDLLQ